MKLKQELISEFENLQQEIQKKNIFHSKTKKENQISKQNKIKVGGQKKINKKVNESKKVNKTKERKNARYQLVTKKIISGDYKKKIGSKSKSRVIVFQLGKGQGVYRRKLQYN